MSRIKVIRESVKVSSDKLDKLRAYSGNLADLMDDAIDLKLAQLKWRESGDLELAIKIIKGEL